MPPESAAVRRLLTEKPVPSFAYATVPGIYFVDTRVRERSVMMRDDASLLVCNWQRDFKLFRC